MEITRFTANVINCFGIAYLYGFVRRKLTKNQIAILTYHRVCPEEKQDGWSYEALSTRMFEEQIAYFCHHWNPISLDELVCYLITGKSLPKKAVVITIDDGYADNYLYAYPILRNHKMPATIFLTTGHIDTGKLFWWDEVSYILQHSTIEQINMGQLGNFNLHSQVKKRQAFDDIAERMKHISLTDRQHLVTKLGEACHVSVHPSIGKELILSWEEIREMNANGIVFGSHTVNHHSLTMLPWVQAKHEIIQSKKDIEDKIGAPVTSFSYPHGEFNHNLANFVRDSGFLSAVTCYPRLTTHSSRPHELGRITVPEDYHQFRVMLSGLWGDIYTIVK